MELRQVFGVIRYYSDLATFDALENLKDSHLGFLRRNPAVVPAQGEQYSQFGRPQVPGAQSRSSRPSSFFRHVLCFSP